MPGARLPHRYCVRPPPTVFSAATSSVAFELLAPLSVSESPVSLLQMNEARLSHLPFWGPSEAVLFLIKRPSGSPE